MTKHKEIKHCLRCNKLLPKFNHSGYCRICYLYERNKKQRLKRREEHKCAVCGIKVKMIKYYPFRCEKCKENQRQADKRFKLKSETKSLNNSNFK